jgi:hypothetical protein
MKMMKNPFDFDIWHCGNCGYVISDEEVQLLKFNILEIKCRCGKNNYSHLHYKKAISKLLHETKTGD